MNGASVLEPDAGKKGTRFRVSAKRVALIACGLPVLAVIAYVIFSTPKSYDSGFKYKGRTLNEWFYGGRTDFPHANREDILAALGAAGTNAFPFLLAKLRHKTGNSLAYFKFYRILPGWARSRLPYPIPDDDIKFLSLMCFIELRNAPEGEYQTFVDCIARFDNARLRYQGLSFFGLSDQSNRALLDLCRKLLDDENAAVRLEAAVWAGESRMVTDFEQPKLFQLLIEGLEKKAVRDVDLGLSTYHFQLPPGSPPPPQGPTPPVVPDQDIELQKRIKRVLERLREHLTAAERERLDAVEKTGKN